MSASLYGRQDGARDVSAMSLGWAKHEPCGRDSRAPTRGDPPVIRWAIASPDWTGKRTARRSSHSRILAPESRRLASFRWPRLDLPPL